MFKMIRWNVHMQTYSRFLRIQSMQFSNCECGGLGMQTVISHQKIGYISGYEIINQRLVKNQMPSYDVQNSLGFLTPWAFLISELITLILNILSSSLSRSISIYIFETEHSLIGCIKRIYLIIFLLANLLIFTLFLSKRTDLVYRCKV